MLLECYGVINQQMFTDFYKQKMFQQFLVQEIEKMMFKNVINVVWLIITFHNCKVIKVVSKIEQQLQ